MTTKPQHTPGPLVRDGAAYKIRELRAKNLRLREALRAMQKACDEWAAEFTQKKRAMNWGVVNDAYCKANAELAGKGE